MRQKTRRLARAVPAWILVILLILSMVPVAHADETARKQVYEGEIELTGKYSGKFSLDSSDLYLFQLENMAPGDSWEGKIHVKNSASAKMEIAILSIVSDLEDTKLFDALDLKISLGDKEIYKGSYGKTEEPISTFYEIPAGKTITFDVKVTFPKECGNEYQNTKMDSTWTFEGRYYGGGGYYYPDPKPDPVKIQTGVDMTTSNTQSAVWLFVSLLCVASCVLMLYRISSAKRGTTETKKKGRE